MKRLLFPAILFAVAVTIRLIFFQGFILGDDPQEFVVVLRGLAWLPWSDDQLFDRFGDWFLNYLVQRPLGTSEATFFSATLVTSSLLPVLAYFSCSRTTPPLSAFLVGLFLATAPFEVFIGTVRANDLFLTACLAAAFLLWQRRQRYPLLTGCGVGFLLWYGFFVKLWVVYAIPILCLGIITTRSFRFLLGLFFSTVLLHLIIAVSFYRQTGFFFPWLHFLPGNGVVPSHLLLELFQIYPRQLFLGYEEYNTTLFGVVPYLWVALLIVMLLRPRGRVLLWADRPGREALFVAVSLFIFLNFFPTAIDFDQFHSPQRIFRYLSPVSFFMTFHCGRLFAKVLEEVRYFHGWSFTTFCWGVVIAANVLATGEATSPGRAFRRTMADLASELRGRCPRATIAETFQSFVLYEAIHRSCPESYFVPPEKPEDVAATEAWLEERQTALPAGSAMITGVGSYVYYRCIGCFLDPKMFEKPLDPRWKLVRSFGKLPYLRDTREILLWSWEKGN